MVGRRARSAHCVIVWRRGDREEERGERGEVTLNEAAAVLQVSAMTVLRLIRNGTLPARHLSKGAPWVIKAADLGKATVRAEAQDRRKSR